MVNTQPLHFPHRKMRVIYNRMGATSQPLGDEVGTDAVAQSFCRRKQLKAPFPPFQTQADSRLLKLHGWKEALLEPRFSTHWTAASRTAGHVSDLLKPYFWNCTGIRLGKQLQVKPSYGITKSQPRILAAVVEVILHHQELEAFQETTPAERGTNTKVSAKQVEKKWENFTGDYFLHMYTYSSTKGKKIKEIQTSL